MVGFLAWVNITAPRGPIRSGTFLLAFHGWPYCGGRGVEQRDALTSYAD